MVFVNRFCVMATLQAARAYLLGLKLDEAYSWGLTRAIFYAAAKRGFKGTSARTGEYRAAKTREEREGPDVFKLGDDMAFKEIVRGRTFFTIGGKVQLPENFERQVVSRFAGRFDKAWEEAVALLKKYGEDVLLSRDRFYYDAYRPNRDVLAERWSKLSGEAGVGERGKSLKESAKFRKAR